MNGDLILFGGPDRPALTRQERAEARRLAEIKSEVRLRRLEGDGALALAAHLMDGARDLDDYRKLRAGEEVDANLLLGEIEATALRQAKRIQASLYDGWGV